jgi:hypothetical protein
VGGERRKFRLFFSEKLNALRTLMRLIPKLGASFRRTTTLVIWRKRLPQGRNLAIPRLEEEFLQCRRSQNPLLLLLLPLFLILLFLLLRQKKRKKSPARYEQRKVFIILQHFV